MQEMTEPLSSTQTPHTHTLTHTLSHSHPPKGGRPPGWEPDGWRHKDEDLHRRKKKRTKFLDGPAEGGPADGAQNQPDSAEKKN